MRPPFTKEFTPSGELSPKKQAVIEVRGSPLHTVYHLKEGSVLLSKYRDDGGLLTTAFFRGPSTLGLTLEQGASNESFRVKALEDSNIAVYDRRLLIGLPNYTKLAQAFQEAEENDRMHLSALIEGLQISKSPEVKAIGLLNLLTWRGKFPSPDMSHEELCQLAGTARAGMTLALNQLESDGMITNSAQPFQPSTYTLTLSGLNSAFKEAQPSLYDKNDQVTTQPYQEYFRTNQDLMELAGMLQGRSGLSSLLAQLIEFLTIDGTNSVLQISQDKISQIIGFNRGSVNQQINEFTKKGFLSATRRRSTSYSITPLGYEAFGFIKEGVSPLRAQRLAPSG